MIRLRGTAPTWAIRAALGIGALTIAAWIHVPRPNVHNTVERVACTITVNETIDLYGALATAATGATVKQAIEQCWNGFRVNWCPMVFTITVRTYPGASTFLGTGDGGTNVKLVAPPYRSNVNRLFGLGTWETSTPPTAAQQWTFCHEAGHIFGLPDDYRDVAGGSVPNPGHAGHMMAQTMSPVVQHEIDDIAKNSGVDCPQGCCDVRKTTTLQDLAAEESFFKTGK
jgi:hypothetical protein